MNLLHKLNNFKRPAHMTRGRLAFVIIVAVVADALQFWLGPLGWLGAVQVIDIVTMILTTLLIGFHILLLPTFLIEFFPLVSAIPTWTGCVLAVLALRARDGNEPVDPSLGQASPLQAPEEKLLPPATLAKSDSPTSSDLNPS